MCLSLIHSETSTFAEGIMGAYVIQFYSAGMGIMLSIFFTSKNFAECLNQWDEFCNRFRLTFPHFPFLVNFSKFRASQTKRLRILLLMLLVCTLCFLLVVSECLQSQSNRCTSQDYQVSIIAFVHGPVTFSLAALELHKCMLLTEALIEAYNQINTALLLSRETKQFQKQPVEKLANLLFFLRKQVKQFFKVGGPVQLVLTGFFFTSAITTWIMILSMLRGELPLLMVIVALGFMLMQILGFVLHTNMLDSIIKLELKIVGIIVEDTSDSLRCRMEVRLFAFIYFIFSIN